MKQYVLAIVSLILASHADVLFAAEKETQPAKPFSNSTVSLTAAEKKPDGRSLFLKNCAHCHGADARGDEGPDLHNLDLTAEQILTRIQNGKKGQMTAFKGKLRRAEIDALVDYVRNLK